MTHTFLKRKSNQSIEAQRQENPHCPQGTSPPIEVHCRTDCSIVSRLELSQIHLVAVPNLELSHPRPILGSSSVPSRLISAPSLEFSHQQLATHLCIDVSQTQSTLCSSPELTRKQPTESSNTGSSQPLPAMERKMEGRKDQILWPRSSEKRESETIYL